MSKLTVDRDVRRTLTLLRDKIRDCGLTQLDVQNRLGWGRSYISQLLTQQKSLRLEHVLMILKILELDPGEFFQEVFARRRPSDRRPARRPAAVARSPYPDGDDLEAGMRDIRVMYAGIVRVLMNKGAITRVELNAAIARVQAQETEEPPEMEASSAVCDVSKLGAQASRLPGDRRR